MRSEIERRLALEIANASLTEEVQHDAKTCLLTPKGLEEVLRSHVQTTPESPLSMIYLDLNDFKIINDTLGHDAGDLAISEVGRILRENLRQHDIAARMGGDEFAIVLRGAQSRPRINQFVLRLHELISEAIEYRDPVTDKIHMITLSFSAGVARYPSDTRDVSLLSI